MELADGLLQLLAFGSGVEQGLGGSAGSGSVGNGSVGGSGSVGSGSEEGRYVQVRMEGSMLRVKTTAVGTSVCEWCYEAVEVLQRLVDAPSFVTILQELIDHEAPEVRP